MNYIKSTKKFVQFYAGGPAGGPAGFPVIGQDEVIYIDKDTEKAYRWNETGSDYVELSSVGSFTDLTDTPATYSVGDAGKVVVVNQTENGLEFVDLSSIALDIDAGDAINITTNGTASTISLDVNPNGDVIQDTNNPDTLIFNSGGATAGYVLSADGNSGATWEDLNDLIDDGNLTSTGSTINVSGSGKVLFDNINLEITPGENNTIMTTDASGNIVWADKSDFEVTPASATVSNGLEFVNGDGVNAVLLPFEIGIEDGGVTTDKIANGAVTLAKIDGSVGTNGQVLKTDGTNAYWGNIAGFMNFKGSVADLTALGAIVDPVVGDVYNVVSDGDHENINYVFVSTGGDTTLSNGDWDNLGGGVDLTGYVGKTEIHTITSDDANSIIVDHGTPGNKDFGIKGSSNINTVINGRNVEINLDDDITVGSIEIAGAGIDLSETTIVNSGTASNVTDVPNWGQVQALNNQEDWAIDLVDNVDLIIYPVNQITIESAPVVGYNSGSATLTVGVNGTPASSYPLAVAANDKLEFKASAPSVWKLVITES